ncbi:MAG: putative transposase [Paracoccaceae bacterium]|jgi:putative transposase
MRDHAISQRRACRLVGVDPKTVRRDQPPDNPVVREEMKAIASKRRRFGDRRIGVPLERKGMFMNHKKLHRLYTEAKLGELEALGLQACAWITNADAGGLAAGQTLVLGFCVRYVWCITQVPYVGCE